MKRHAALVPLSHDHHHGLVEARRLRHAAPLDEAGRREAAAAFLEFFDRETRAHFREEEERFFPLLTGADDPATELRARALREHRQLHDLAAALEKEASATAMGELGEALERHIRFEERELFPVLEDALRREGANT